MKPMKRNDSLECRNSGKRVRHLLVPIGALLFLSTALAASPLDKLWFIGYPAHFHERRGYLDFGEDRVQELPKGDLFTAGAVVGKRFSLPGPFRLQLSGSLGYGTTIDDTLPSIMVGDTLFPTQIQLVLFSGNVVADLQYPVAVSSDAAWYWHVGYGCHYIDIAEYEMIDNDPKRKVLDDYLEERHMLSGSVHGGFGFEIAITGHVGIALSYTLRYWNPVHYGMVRDLFPEKPVPYRERFLSHEFDVILLVKRY